MCAWLYDAHTGFLNSKLEMFKMTVVTTQKSYQNRPKAIGITARKLQFNPKAIRRHYFANSPVMSHLLTALSSTFPIGEQFFVHSVRNV